MTDQHTSEHYEVTWKVHWNPTDSRAKRSVNCSTLEVAQLEAERIARKNDLFIQDEDGFPFVADIQIWHIETTLNITRVEQAVSDD